MPVVQGTKSHDLTQYLTKRRRFVNETICRTHTLVCSTLHYAATKLWSRVLYVSFRAPPTHRQVCITFRLLHSLQKKQTPRFRLREPPHCLFVCLSVYVGTQFKLFEAIHESLHNLYTVITSSL